MATLHLGAPAELIIGKKNIQEPKHSMEYNKTSLAIPMKLALGMTQIWECCLPLGSHPFSFSSAEMPKHEWKPWKGPFPKAQPIAASLFIQTAHLDRAAWVSLRRVGFPLDCEGTRAAELWELLDTFFCQNHYIAVGLLLIAFVCTC